MIIRKGRSDQLDFDLNDGEAEEFFCTRRSVQRILRESRPSFQWFCALSRHATSHFWQVAKSRKLNRQRTALVEWQQCV